jgi:hypothetical protein
MGGNRRNAIVLQEKEKLIYEWLMKGWSHKRIGDELMANHGYKTKSNCDAVIAKVIKSFKPNNEVEIEDLRAEYLEMYRDLYRTALENGETKTANSIMDSIIKLQGLAINKIEAKVETTFEVSFE